MLTLVSDGGLVIPALGPGWKVATPTGLPARRRTIRDAKSVCWS